MSRAVVVALTFCSAAPLALQLASRRMFLVLGLAVAYALCGYALGYLRGKEHGSAG